MKKITFFSILVFVQLLSSCGPSESEIAESRDRQERIDSIDRALELKIQLRRDSLNYYLLKSDSLHSIKSSKNSLIYLDSAITFANIGEKNPLIEKKASYFYEFRDYDSSILYYSMAIDDNHNKSNNYYGRAVCYQKKRKYQESVNDLRNAIKLGNMKADSLHEIINPEKKRVAYYVTRCCDGTTSNSNGRGACSHHGGVCNWNDPVYETYRKY